MITEGDEEKVLERIRTAVEGLDISDQITALAVMLVEKALHALRRDDGSDDPAKLKECLGLTAGLIDMHLRDGPSIRNEVVDKRHQN